MKKVTCRFCLLPTATRTVKGELTDLYLCHHCGEGFDLDHPPQAHTTEARPQSFHLAAIGDLAAIEPQEAGSAT